MADNLTPVSFADLMAASEPPASLQSAAANLTPVRYFTKDGLDEVAKLLKTIRTDKTLHRDEVEDLLDDPQYAKPLAGSYAIDREKIFATKLALCEYFRNVFTESFCEGHRKDSGLWTWIAFAYYGQFVKTVRDTTKIASDARWIFDPENYRLSMRHFVAGALYLYNDFYETSDEVKDMLFSSPPREFGGFVDAVTYRMEGTRMPALMQVAAWLYYDSSSSKKLQKGATHQDKPGTIRELLRVVSQLAQTRDFYGVEDAHELWSVLPEQFNVFKIGKDH